MNEIKLIIEGQEVVIKADNREFGSNFKPPIKNHQRADKNTMYKYTKWTVKDGCDTKHTCEMHGRDIDWFFETKSNVCNGFKVFLIVRESPYTQKPNCGK
ncbi:hypothetical protein DFQ09_11055 [Winogradskyella pacifica]|uniref:Uncharacterized protein n=1 Tax=Winogradskyella pacifica TaxID=664642 RepID=A0A3D9LKE1_9FLAO|nr:hypothetical protein [Winogradskyella pacifica]REE07861.1 hypothetical protein DFQ09_11055 [Winogradskyella pacifica]